ncbi:unnamed protein product [Penicillium pancosmium]
MDRRIMEIMAEEIKPIKQLAGFLPNVIFQPLYEGAIRAGHERGGNALGINADGPLTSGSSVYKQQLYNREATIAGFT